MSESGLVSATAEVTSESIILLDLIGKRAELKVPVKKEVVKRPYRTSKKKVDCRVCGKTCKEHGLLLHMTRMHGEGKNNNKHEEENILPNGESDKYGRRY